MSKLFAICAPILPGKEKTWRDFINDVNNKYKSSYTESRRNLKVRERTFHQATPMGEMVIVTLEGENPAEAFSKFAAGDDEFTKWFVEKVKEIHGLDLAEPPKGPMPEMVIDSGA